MTEYKGYFMLGTALMIHPHSPDWRALGTVYSKNPLGSIVEIGHVGGPAFTTKDAAERYGLVLCQAFIETKLEEAHDDTKDLLLDGDRRLP
jgi:hypothetical protein